MYIDVSPYPIPLDFELSLCHKEAPLDATSNTTHSDTSVVKQTETLEILFRIKHIWLSKTIALDLRLESTYSISQFCLFIRDI